MQGEAGGGGGGFLPSFAVSPPDLSRPPRQALLSKRLSSKQAPPLGVLLSECVKQWPAGFPARKPGSRLHRCTWVHGVRERGLGLSTRPTLAPGFLPPKFSLLPPTESARARGQKVGTLRLPQHQAALPLPGPGQSHFPFAKSSELLLGPSATPHLRIVSDVHSAVQDRRREGMRERGEHRGQQRSTPGLE